jgi:hypothetical protein
LFRDYRIPIANYADMKIKIEGFDITSSSSSCSGDDNCSNLMTVINEEDDKVNVAKEASETESKKS